MFLNEELYKSPQTEVKVDPYSLPALVAWLEKQPAGTAYDYYCKEGTCLLDQYIKSVTGRDSRPTELHTKICSTGAKGQDKLLPYFFIAQTHPQTFGGALARARSLLPEGK